MTPHQSGTHVVLGGSGAAGSSILAALAETGLPALGVSRSDRPQHIPAAVGWATVTDSFPEGPLPMCVASPRGGAAGMAGTSATEAVKSRRDR